jgi:hypothetical protein
MTLSLFPLQLLHPRPDRFDIRAQSALTSISHISDLCSLNTSTNHQPSHHFSSPNQTLFAIHDFLLSQHCIQSTIAFLIRRNRCHVGRAAETSGFQLITAHSDAMLVIQDIHHLVSVCSFMPPSGPSLLQIHTKAAR